MLVNGETNDLDKASLDKFLDFLEAREAVAGSRVVIVAMHTDHSEELFHEVNKRGTLKDTVWVGTEGWTARSDAHGTCTSADPSVYCLPPCQANDNDWCACPANLCCPAPPQLSPRTSLFARLTAVVRVRSETDTCPGHSVPDTSEPSGKRLEPGGCTYTPTDVVAGMIGLTPFMNSDSGLNQRYVAASNVIRQRQGVETIEALQVYTAEMIDALVIHTSPRAICVLGLLG